jgi:ADP-heptose:LPS heptosyltransferase
MRYLIIQTAFIGDAILATAILEAIREQDPAASIDLLVRKGNEHLFRDHPFLGTIWAWDKKGAKYSNLLQLIRKVRKERYDRVINLQRFGASGLLTMLSGAKETVGFDKNPFSRFFSYRLPHQIGDGTHEVTRNLRLLEPWWGVLSARPRLYPPALPSALREKGPYICIAPTSVWYTKQWPPEKWVELIDRIPPIFSVLLLGGPGDWSACEAIANSTRHPAVENKAGVWSLLESAACMSKAVLNFVNDSAPLHLASAVNAPVVAVFCSTIPAFGFTPLSDQHWVCETPQKLDCRPCGLHGKKACPEGHFRCADILIDQLLAPLQELSATS